MMGVDVVTGEMKKVISGLEIFKLVDAHGLPLELIHLELEKII